MAESRLKIIQFVRGSERYGAAVSIKNLCGELHRRGHEVVLLLGSDGNLGMGSSPLRTIEVRPYHKFDIRGILEIRAILMREKPDLIHTHLSSATLAGSFAAKLARVPAIATVHGMNRRWTYDFANRLITVSEAGKQNLVDQGVNPDRISVAYNGIPMPTDEAMSQRDSKRKELGLDENSVLLGAVSRADHGKGVQDALTAIAMLLRRVPNIHFAFAGEGDYLSRLRYQAKVLGLEPRVQFLGFQNGIYELLSAIDLFIFPSLREAMGISIVEAMAMGKPIVGTKVGGIPEVVDSKSGILVPASDAPALADACLQVLSNPERMRSMGQHARSRALSQFSLSTSAEAVENAYELLLARYRRRVTIGG